MSKIPENDEMNMSDYPSSLDLATAPETAGQSVTDYIKKEIEKIKEGIWEIYQFVRYGKKSMIGIRNRLNKMKHKKQKQNSTLSEKF